ncbi:type VI secretion system baseplate subunit TssE [Aquitalea sp. ASV11]|uniref:type VI secretion system baseplate subunit TssE n=1 Tax=Aquitalea sp. ASV11 TaxID=2795103 RepID=UPI0018EADA39|nr:type VI secretion system baseplate subunit TssE [Aquitalea sp. ASV11]
MNTRQRHSGPSLYEKLLGNFQDGSSLHAWDENSQHLFSVMDNIRVILNSRQGAIKHLPDYGLPDLAMIYRHLPASAHLLRQHIASTLLRYEPRLAHIDIQLLANAQDDVLGYELICHLKQSGLVRFGSYFTPDHAVRLQLLGAAEQKAPARQATPLPYLANRTPRST